MNASGDEKPSIAEETSAFKVVTLYYAYKMKLSPDPKDVEPFSGYAQQIADNRRGIGKGSPSGNNSVVAEHDF